MFQVQILGTSAAIPTISRRPSAQVVTYNDRHHLVDCGEGTQMQLLKYRVRIARLDAIFISHLHGDHILGLPGFLNTLSIYERTAPLKLFGPPGLQRILSEIFTQTQSYLNYEVEFVSTQDFEPGEVIYKKGTLEVSLLPLTHRIFCRGFLFKEVNKKQKFDFYKAKSLEIPNVYFSLLKQGNAVTLPDGRTIEPDQVLAPPDQALSYAYCSDTQYEEKLLPYINQANLLYHEATFMHDMLARAKETAHSTAQQAATIAAKAEVRQLILGHYSARYKKLDPLVAEARAVFPASELAEQGKIYHVKDYL